MKVQYNPREQDHKVVIRGNYHGDKCLASLNDYISELGKNPKAGNRMKQNSMTVCMDAIRAYLKRWKPSNPVILHYHYYEPLKGQKRDLMNVHAYADKCFEDALQKCKVIVNDSPEYVVNTTHDFFYTKSTVGIIVYIEEVSNSES